MTLPQPGQVVRIRQRRYLVEDVRSGSSGADATFVRLACLDDDAQGQPLDALWEIEPDAEVLTTAGWNRLADRGFDPPRRFSAYPTSSIRERVYASDAGYGILLYTGSPDAEGTLGGLVETGRQIARHLQAALEIARLCSNDPVCAQHDPTGAHEARHLHGAACHGCLLVSETSCEQQNDFLDRALVVPTVDDGGAEFFRD